MSNHTKRAAVVIAVLATFAIVRIARVVTVTASGGLARSFGVTEALTTFVVAALLMGGLIYGLSRWSSHRPAARR
jgi:predicted transporter